MNLDPVTVTLDDITLDWYEADIWQDMPGATPADKLRLLLDVFAAAQGLAADCGEMSVTDETEFAAAHPLAAKISENLVYLTAVCYGAVSARERKP